MMTICTVLDPIFQLYQQLLNFSFTIVNFFGISTPSAKSLFGGFLGCA